MNYIELEKTTTGHAVRSVAGSKKPFTLQGLKMRSRNIANMARDVHRVADNDTNRKALEMLYWHTLAVYCERTLSRHGRQLSTADYLATRELEQEACNKVFDIYEEIKLPSLDVIPLSTKLDKTYFQSLPF